MSLKLAAEHLKNQGRGSDTELVHMTKDEVRGLQTMAKAHGGSLTINPETGLAEAGFLSSILPAIAGIAAVALAPETGGASLAGYEALVAGGVGLADYAITGNLKQGIMAGIGAYGGMGIGEGLMSAGSAAMDAGAGLTNAAAVNTPGAVQTATSNIDPSLLEGMTKEQVASANVLPVNPESAPMTNTQLMGQGFSSAAQSPMQFAANNMGSIGAAAAPVLSGAFNNPTIPGAQPQKNPFGLKTLSPDFQATSPAQPSPHYQAQYTDYTKNPYQPGPGPQHMAVGGIAQAQDKNFTSGDMYPGSQIDSTQYASSPQTPMSMQATLASYDPETNPLTGEPTTHMASGGIASYSGTTNSLVDAANAYNSATKYGNIDLPKTSGADAGIYTDTDPNTRNLDAYNAALYNFKKRTKNAGMGKDAVALKDVQPLGNIEADAHGGIVGMAFGGPVQQAISQVQAQNTHANNFQPGQSVAPQVYHPNYGTYGQAQYAPQASQGIPIPTRTSMPASSGYAIDPMSMQGSPAYKAQQAILADQAAAQLAASQNDYASGGSISGLGGYSDGGRLLRGPGDGMSDSIPAQIGKHQPARLADGEFVVPADVVSHLGNGSTEAGAKQLYAMMDKIRSARTGKKKQAPDVKPEKYLPK